MQNFYFEIKSDIGLINKDYVETINNTGLNEMDIIIPGTKSCPNITPFTKPFLMLLHKINCLHNKRKLGQ